jgi:putative intracellular protease/amidase
MQTPEKAIYLFIFDGFADWEPAHAIAELRRQGGYRVETVALTGQPVLSMGGVRVLPSTTVAEVDPSRVAVLILPGGDPWENGPVDPAIAGLVQRLDGAGVPIAAICAATTAVVRMGLLRGRLHTSNGLPYLRQYVPGYSDAAVYVDAPAVRDRGLITASGLADVEFAREIFEELDVMTPEDRELWASMFRMARMPADARRTGDS